MRNSLLLLIFLFFSLPWTLSLSTDLPRGCCITLTTTSLPHFRTSPPIPTYCYSTNYSLTHPPSSLTSSHTLLPPFFTHPTSLLSVSCTLHFSSLPHTPSLPLRSLPPPSLPLATASRILWERRQANIAWERRGRVGRITSLQPSREFIWRGRGSLKSTYECYTRWEKERTVLNWVITLCWRHWEKYNTKNRL